MAKVYATIVFALLVAAVVSAKDACYLEASPGGCPNTAACIETCSPCFRDIGSVQASCVAPEAIDPYWRCRCDFLNGAPCPPRGEPRCPGAPAIAQYYNIAH